MPALALRLISPKSRDKNPIYLLAKLCDNRALSFSFGKSNLLRAELAHP